MSFHTIFLKIACFLSLMLFSSACAHYYYAPTEGNLLALQEQNDFKLSAGTFSISDRAYGGTAQVGYSPIKHLSIQSSGFYKASNLEEGSGKSSGYFASVTVGTYAYFKNRKRASSEKSFLIDVHTGYGMGQVNNWYANGAYSNFHFNRAFLQGGLHFQDSLVGFSAALKRGTLDFTEGLIDGNPGFIELHKLENLQEKDLYDTMELSLRAFYKLEKFDLYFTLTGLWTRNAFFEITNFRDTNVLPSFMNISTVVGVVFDLNEFKRNKSTSEGIIME